MKQYILIMEEKSYFRMYMIKLEDILLDVYIWKKYYVRFLIVYDKYSIIFYYYKWNLIYFQDNKCMDRR